jgi:cellulase
LTHSRHHDWRNDTDDVIDTSHHGTPTSLPNPNPTNNTPGPSLIYISPDPPTENSFVKLWHSGKYVSNPFPQAGKWSTTSDIKKNFGHMNMRIPEGLKAGQYASHNRQESMY